MSGCRHGRWLSWRELSLAGLAAAFAVGAIYLTRPTMFEGVDWLQLHLPARQHLAAALQAGRLPLWNPYVALGRPFLADMETAVLYPPNLLYVLVEPSLAYAVLAVAHATLAIAGMLLLGRLLAIAPWARWLCGLLFVASEAVVARAQSGQVHSSNAVCYLPLVLFLAAQLADAPGWSRVATLAVAFALQFLSGHPQIPWLSWIAVAAFALARAGSGREAFRAGVALALALATALLLAAPTLLPFLELLGQGNRGVYGIAFSGQDAMTPFYWSSLAVPDGGARAFYWEFNVYTGLLTLVGGVAGLLATWRERDGRALLAVAVVGLLLGSGTQTPAFRVFYYVVPGTSAFRLPARAALLVVVALVLGLGLLVSRRLSRTGAATALAGGAAAAALLTGVYYACAPAGLVPLSPAPRVAWILATVASLALASTVRPRLRSAGCIVAVVLAALDVGSAIPSAKHAWRYEVRREGEPPVRDLLMRLGLYEPRGAPPRIAVPPELVRENAGLVYGWSNFAGYQAVSLSRVWVFLHRSLGVPPPLETTFPSPLIYARGPFPYDSMSLAVGVEPEQARLVGRHPADPRAYVSTGTRVVDDWHEAIAAMSAGHDFHAVALVESAIASLPEGGGRSPGASARILSFAPETIEVETRSGFLGLLVLAEPWYPGWVARVDGNPEPCVPANAWMRAVRVPAGTHRVTLEFHSRWFGLGAALSIAAFAALAALVWGESRGRNATPAPPSSPGRDSR